MDRSGQQRSWTVDEAQTRLPEILRLAAEEGPQQIGTDRPFVVVLAETWFAQKQVHKPSQQESRKPMGQWLVENMPHGVDLELPDRREPYRPTPFLNRGKRMSGCLLDTNVVSEIVRVSPDPQVRSFLLEQSELWLSMIALHELEFGLNLLPQGRRREALRTALPTCLETYADRILPVARAEAEQAAVLRVQARRAGRVLHPADALIAGTSIVHNLILATRNVNDFTVLDVNVVNPWEAP